MDEIPKWINNFRNLLNEQTGWWHEQAVQALSSESKSAYYQKWWSRLAPHLPSPDATLKVLDAGCGFGVESILYAKTGYSVFSCDLNGLMLEGALERAIKAQLANPPQFVAGSLYQLPYKDGEFDLVNCPRLALDLIPRPGYALRELRRIIKPGGKLVLTVLGANSPVKNHYWLRFLQGIDPQADHFVQFLNGITPWEVEKILPVLGWQVLHQEGEYGPSAAGIANPFTKEEMEKLPRLLQQTAASAWLMICEAI